MEKDKYGMISLTCEIQKTNKLEDKSKIKEQSKLNKNKHIDSGNSSGYWHGRGRGRVKQVKGSTVW